MDRPSFQLTVASMLGVVACFALNFWLFRLGALWGILGLNITKHVVIAYLCQVLGVDRPKDDADPNGNLPAPPPTALRAPHLPVS